METIYDVDYFIKKYKAIPSTYWYVGRFCNPMDESMKCAWGHCGLTEGNKLNNEASALEKLLCLLKTTYIYGLPPAYYIVPAINDGYTEEYKQATPKERILAALHDVKKLQQSEKSETIVIEKIKYVSVPESITKEVSFTSN